MKMVLIEKELGNESFYRKAIEIVKESKFFRGAAKTPVLILPSERTTKERKEYYDALIKRIRERNTEDNFFYVKYLFSLPRTEEAIIEEVRKNGKSAWEEIKKEWMELANNWTKVELRYVDHEDFISCIIGDHHTLIGWKGGEDKRIIAITYLTNEMSFYKDVFDEIHQKGSNAHKEAIEKIEKKLKELKLID